ncbi:MAG: exosortase C-terminal domain/associated protein EpsI, partial [Gammaproteobacteria bacterium]
DLSRWQVRERELVQNGRRRLVWSWFNIGGSRVPSLSQAKLHEVLGIVKGDRSGALLAVSTVCAETCADAAPRLEAFLTISEEALHQLSDTDPVVGL